MRFDPHDASRQSVADLASFLLCGGATVLYLGFGVPFGSAVQVDPRVLAGFRVGVALLVLVRTLRSGYAPVLMFGHERYDPGTLSYPGVLLALKLPLAVSLLVGLLTDVVAGLLFVVHSLVVFESEYYSMENVLLQMVYFYSPFLGLGAALSVDARLGLPPAVADPVVVNSLFVTTGVFMFSAGYEKVKSDIWRDGTAAAYFLQAPHLTRPALRPHVTRLLSIDGLGAGLTYAVVGGELLFLFGPLDRYLFGALLVLFLGFAATLALYTGLSFIGEVQGLALALFAVPFFAAFDEYGVAPSTAGADVSPVAAAAVALNLTALFAVLYPDHARRLGVGAVQKYLTGLAGPVRVFNREYRFGFCTYRLEGPDGGTVRAFDAEGRMGERLSVRPLHFQSATYHVSDFCLQLMNGESVSEETRSRVVDLCYAGLVASGRDRGTVRLLVKVCAVDDPEAYLERPWVEVGVCTVTDDGVELTVTAPDPP